MPEPRQHLYRLRIELQDITPGVWRRVLVGGDRTLNQASSMPGLGIRIARRSASFSSGRGKTSTPRGSTAMRRTRPCSGWPGTAGRRA